MTRQWTLSLLATLCLSATAFALSASDIAFVAPAPLTKAERQARKKAKNGKKGPEMLWIRLEPYQLRAVQRKNHVQNKLSRFKTDHQRQLAPIELSKTQRLAIRKALKIRKPYRGRVYLYVDFRNRARHADRNGFFVLRPLDQFKESRPSDPKP